RRRIRRLQGQVGQGAVRYGGLQGSDVRVQGREVRRRREEEDGRVGGGDGEELQQGRQAAGQADREGRQDREGAQGVPQDRPQGRRRREGQGGAREDDRVHGQDVRVQGSGVRAEGHRRHDRVVEGAGQERRRGASRR